NHQLAACRGKALLIRNQLRKLRGLYVLQAFGPQDEREISLVAVKGQITTKPAFGCEIGDAPHLEAFRILCVSLNLKVSVQDSIFWAGIHFEGKLALSQRQGDLTIDVKMSTQLGDPW